MNPAVSVILPVYNAEATLRRCVESVLNQEYTDLELLLIDDGSRDGSGALCDGFAAADPRVRVFHKENSGVSDTRNLGLERARGRWLQFLDADDWITPDATKLLVRAAEDQGCDLVICDFYRVVGERVSHKGDIDEDRLLTREEFAAHMMENPADYYYGVLWNKLYRRDIVERHRLRMDPAISWCEDFMFNLEYIRRSDTFFALQVPLYYYVKTKGSLCNQDITISRTIQMKLTVFEYYNQFYKTVLSEEEYERRRLKIYRFLIDAAQDGAVSPAAARLGSERIRVPGQLLAEEGVLFDHLRDRKLLDHYLEPAALKHGLTLPEARLLLYLERWTSGSRKELADFTGLPPGTLSALLKHLASKGLLTLTAPRAPKGTPRQLSVTLSPAAAAVREELEQVRRDFDAARFFGFRQEEREQYQQMADRVQDNIRSVLG